jgi:hypothetical protein
VPQIEAFTKKLPLDFVFDRTVKQYPYRTASARNRFLEMRRDSDDKDFNSMLDSMEYQLANAAGVAVDNHVVYRVATEEGMPLYVMFHDFFVYVGLSVEERAW